MTANPNLTFTKRYKNKNGREVFPPIFIPTYSNTHSQSLFVDTSKGKRASSKRKKNHMQSLFLLCHPFFQIHPKRLLPTFCLSRKSSTLCLLCCSSVQNHSQYICPGYSLHKEDIFFSENNIITRVHQITEIIAAASGKSDFYPSSPRPKSSFLACEY